MVAAALASAYFLNYAATAQAWHFIDNVNLIFHEAGHTIFTQFIFGQFIHVLMGSGFQSLLPALIATYFFYTQQRLSGAICLMWVGQNLINVSIYAGDSIVMQLPLLGGDKSLHDWHYLLTTLGVLQYTSPISGTIYAFGLITLAIGAALSFYFAWTEDGSQSTFTSGKDF